MINHKNKIQVSNHQIQRANNIDQNRIVRTEGLNVKFFKYQDQSTGDVLLEKQPPDVFCKKSCSEKFRRLRSATLFKKDSVLQVFSYKFCEISKNTFSENTSGRLLLLLKICFQDKTFSLKNIRDVVFHLIKFHA